MVSPSMKYWQEQGWIQANDLNMLAEKKVTVKASDDGQMGVIQFNGRTFFVKLPQQHQGLQRHLSKNDWEFVAYKIATKIAKKNFFNENFHGAKITKEGVTPIINENGQEGELIHHRVERKYQLIHGTSKDYQILVNYLANKINPPENKGGAKGKIEEIAVEPKAPKNKPNNQVPDKQVPEQSVEDKRDGAALVQPQPKKDKGKVVKDDQDSDSDEEALLRKDQNDKQNNNVGMFGGKPVNDIVNSMKNEKPDPEIKIEEIEEDFGKEELPDIEVVEAEASKVEEKKPFSYWDSINKYLNNQKKQEWELGRYTRSMNKTKSFLQEDSPKQNVQTPPNLGKKPNNLDFRKQAEKFNQRGIIKTNPTFP